MFGVSREFTSTYYYYVLTSKINQITRDEISFLDLLLTGTGTTSISTQSLASTSVQGNNDVADVANYGVRILSRGKLVSSNTLYMSHNKNLNQQFAVRPVVILNPKLKLQEDGFGKWKLY